jgi:hypothetical protein
VLPELSAPDANGTAAPLAGDLTVTQNESSDAWQAAIRGPIISP